MENRVDGVPEAPLPSVPQRRRFRLPLALGFVIAFALALGIGVLLNTTLFSTAQAANPVQGNAQTFQTLVSTSTPGSYNHGPGQCDVLTVTGISGQTITAKASDGTSVTIHTTSSTVYVKGGQTVTAGSVTVGVQIRVQGTRNSDGSITATRIDIG